MMLDIENQIGKKFAEVRKRHLGVTQKEIAKNFDISAMMISKYETGKAKLPVSFLILFCMKYDLSPTIFFSDFLKNLSTTKEIEHLLDRANDLTEADKKKLFETLLVLINGFEKK